MLSGTKNEDKVKAIKGAVEILEDFLDKFDAENRSSTNKAYLAADILDQLPKSSDKLIAEFVEVYTAKRNYKMLRTVGPTDSSSEGDTTWDIIRNRELSKIKCDDGKLFKDNGDPSDAHLKMIYWAYSPQPAKVKSYYAVEAVKSGTKRLSTGDASESPAKRKR